MFTKRITYTKKDGTWNDIEEAWGNITILDEGSRTAEEIARINEIIASEDLSLPSDVVLNEDGTEYSFTSSVTQDGLDVLNSFSNASERLDESLIKSTTEWVAV